MPKFMFLQYVDEARAPRPGTPEMTAQIDAYATLLEEAQAAGVMRGGDACQPSAAVFSVQVRDAETKTSDGPMSAQAPGLNGYFVFECKDRAEAIAWAAKNPAANGGTVEVHPILEF
ncbi:MAG: YciI family protein [Chloroflexota bacterium]